MPREYSDKPQPLTESQKKPHLALAGRNGQWLTIPPGATIAYVEDATRADGVIPWVLVSVGKKKWEFRCACGRKECTRTMSMTAQYKGQHSGPKVVE